MSHARLINGKVNILLVDDKPANLLALSAILARPEYNLISVKSGEAALQEMALREFAVILVDVMMPKMDGFELAAIIKKEHQNRRPPIIFLTAASHDINKIYKAYSVGGIDYLQKPLDADVVKAKVAVFVELFQKSQQIKLQNELIRESDLREQEFRLIEAKRLGETRYRKLADAVPHIVWIASPDGAIEYLNERWFEYTGLALQESKDCFTGGTTMHIEDLPRFGAKWKTSLKSGDRLEVECRLRRKSDGRYRWHLCRALVEVSTDGDIVAWLGTFTDIDEQKRAEDQLKILRTTADAANKAKSDFLAHMSHEIRTPLGAICGFTDLILDPASSEDEKNDWVSTIKRNCLHLSKLVDDVLDLSKIEAGQLEIEKSAFQIEDVMFEVQTSLSQHAASKGLFLKFNWMGGLVSTIYTDKIRLRQILINVIGNAIKFTDAGGVRVDVSIDKETTPGKDSLLTFVVSDTGPGLAEFQSERLFQPFSQADKSTSRKFGGSGLGLVLSRRIASALGGNLVLAQSAPGKGSTFVLTIKTGASELQKMHSQFQGNSVKKNPPKDIRLDGLKILLVEDNLDNQKLFQRFLKFSGAEVELAQDGKEGVAKALSGKHDLIVMDVQMPELDGYRATSSIRESGYDRPIIALTAHVMKGERERCLAAGYSDYLSKPVDRVKLMETIAYHAERAPRQD